MAARQTPVMRQHAEAKLTHPDAVLFFRLGDFYEMFGDDAVLCSQVLDLTLTSRNKGKPDEIPMAGVPHHAAHGYIGRLLAAGHKVAVCEQMADPATVKGIVPRQVVRVLTPGTVTHHDHLDAKENNWLAALNVGPSQIGVALYDLSTGELAAGSLANAASAAAELARSAPREILVATDNPEVELKDVVGLLQSALPLALVSSDAPLDEASLPHDLVDIVNDAASLSEFARAAALQALRFARHCNPAVEIRPTRLAPWNPGDTVAIDPTAESHLELCSSQSGDRRLTLLATIDQTQTALGARCLRRRLLAPLKEVAAIRQRHDQVEAFALHSGVRDALRSELKNVTDLERLSVRADLGEANPRDLGRLRDGLLAAGQAAQTLINSSDSVLLSTLDIETEVDVVSDLAKQLDMALVDSPPAQAKEGAIFREGYDNALTELHQLCTRGTQHTIDLETRLRGELDIPTLKVRYTRVFGWYVEVSRSHLGRVPQEFRRKQTVASGERYTLEELDDLAERLRGAEDQFRTLELTLFKNLVRQVKNESLRLSELSSRIAMWDCSSALAELAHARDFVRPVVDDSEVLEIQDGRHPVVERWSAAGKFVPNDVNLDVQAERLWLITGPNMAGKSTLLRQTALIAILAQMGSFVPAKAARIGIVDRVMSRVGASDNLARGESTFMVEMRETAEILNAATRRSLIILDEVGRGTSTFDGLAIASAVAEHLAHTVLCRVLFATHYHEITALADASVHVANYSVSARETDGNLVFLHRLVPGAASQSHGIAVAQLAGLPDQVLGRARELLSEYESTNDAPACDPPLRRRAKGVNPKQLSLFQAPSAGASAAERDVLKTLSELNVDEIRPIEALGLLEKMKKQLSS